MNIPLFGWFALYIPYTSAQVKAFNRVRVRNSFEMGGTIRHNRLKRRTLCLS